MKIIFCSYHNPHYLTITEYIERALKKLSHNVEIFDDRSFIIPGKIRKRFKSLHYFDLKRINRNLLKLVERFKPDIYLETGGYRIFPETIKIIKNMGIKTILWTIDPIKENDPRIKMAEFYDYVFCGGTEMIEVLKENNVKIKNGPFFLPFACDPEIHKRIEDLSKKDKEKYKADISFVGSYYSNREEIFKNLLDFNFKIWGPGWKKAKSPINKIANDEKLKVEEWRKIYSLSKIVLVVHYNDGINPCYQVSPKVYEILSCRGFLIVDNQRDLNSLFEDGKHLVIFHNVKDLKEKIEYYLNHPEEREKIAKEGYKEVIKKHSYCERLKKLLEIVEKK